MKIKYLDRKQVIMRQTNSTDSTNVMNLAFRNILDEIMEHVIEGFCFEAHRAVKLGYFQVDGYRLKNHEFEKIEPTENGEEKISTENGEEKISTENGDQSMVETTSSSLSKIDIFGNESNESVKNHTKCLYCKQSKAITALGRHMISCKARHEKSMNNSDDNDNSDRKKEKDVNKQQKNMANYDTMSPEETKEFLTMSCGVVSKRTGRPCSKSPKCSLHSEKDRDNIRSFIFRSFASHFGDSNIDDDTVDQ